MGLGHIHSFSHQKYVFTLGRDGSTINTFWEKQEKKTFRFLLETAVNLISKLILLKYTLSQMHISKLDVYISVVLS